MVVYRMFTKFSVLVLAAWQASLLLVLTAAKVEPNSTPVSIRHTFEEDEPGVLPAGFTSSLTGSGEPEKWVVQDDPTAPSGRRVVAQFSSDKTSYRFPLLLHTLTIVQDVELSVQFKPVSGRVDQAAGLVWRYQDENNYYVVRANALENNVVLYKLEAGKRSNLPVKGARSSYGVMAPVHDGEWQSLRVAARGPHFDVYLNDQKLFEVEDETFAGPGQLGLWTKADSVTYFDDFNAVVYPSVLPFIGRTPSSRGD